MIRFLLLAMLISCASKPPDRSSYRAAHTSGLIAIDGKDDETDWQRATASPAFLAPIGGKEVQGEANARLLWDDRFLYAFVNVKDRDVSSPFPNHDDPLWKADCIEMFIDADGTREGYIEIQVNPQNAHLDVWFPKTRREPHAFAWTSRVQSAVTVDGTLNQPNDLDRGWNVELAIPHEDVRGMDADMKVSIPPQAGDTWRINLVRTDVVRDVGYRASSWSQIPLQDFHAIDRLLTMTFVR
jgi:hypothetical protein